MLSKESSENRASRENSTKEQPHIVEHSGASPAKAGEVAFEGYKLPDIKHRIFTESELAINPFDDKIDWKISGPSIKHLPGYCNRPPYETNTPFDVSKALPLIRSHCEKRLFRSLSLVFPYVFKEIPAAGFIKFETIKEQLSYKERRKYFTLRYDFVCCNREFMPILVLEYNGPQHFTEGDPDSVNRRMKRKFCDLASMDFIQINTESQLDSVLRSIDFILFCRKWREDHNLGPLSLVEESWHWRRRIPRYQDAPYWKK